ncbi:MAG: protein kinase [Planctomycetes bacterium]|nr:protein kinase [Planctomycetota bacterium]
MAQTFAHFVFDPQQDRLGEGPLSEVYRAMDQQLGRTVALKILRGNAEIDPAADTRFLREAQHTSQLVHPNIATIYEYGKHEGTSFIAMEYLQGRTLDKVIKDQPLSYDEGLRIAIEVARALELVHQNGLIHRDLKPGNVMVLEDGTVKLLDFGIARARDEATITQNGMLVGTVLYMSPEQVRGDELDLRSDVFAFGAVLYHALTGALPFPGKSFPEVCMAILDGKLRRPTAIRADFPPALEDFILKCLDPEPERRYSSAVEAKGVLQSIFDGSRSGGSAPIALRGTIVMPPLVCGGEHPEACDVIAGALLKDAAANLARVKDLKVARLDSERLPGAGASFDYVLRLRLEVIGVEGRLEIELERWTQQPGGTRGTAPLEVFRENVQHIDKNDWALQEALVRGVVRVVRKHLSAIALRPAAGPRRNTEAALTLARRAHEVMHRGTTKHLLGSITSFRAAIEADPYCAIAYAGLAEALVRKYIYFDGDTTYLDEARAEAARALARSADCAEAHTSLGFAFHLTNRATDAQREYRLSIQLNQNEWLAHRLLGAVYARLGNFKEASPLLRKSITLHPRNIASYDHLYGVLMRLNRYEEALQVADQGITAAIEELVHVPDNQEARLHMGMLLARCGRQAEARDAIAKARELSPKDGYTAFKSAVVLAILGDLNESLEALSTAATRGYCIQSELARNVDLDVLRGLPDFQSLVA